MKVSSTDFQNAVGKYLALLDKEPIIITKNGKSVAKVTAYTDPSDYFVHEARISPVCVPKSDMKHIWIW